MFNLTKWSQLNFLIISNFLRDLFAKSGALVLTFERDLLEKVIVTYSLLGYTNMKAFVGGPTQYVPGFLLIELAVDKLKERLRGVFKPKKTS